MKHWQKFDEQAQSLVEMAIVAPILILMFLGVFEVGWVIRSYMLLSVASRESARIATKVCTLNWEATAPETIGQTKVFSQMLASSGYRLPGADWQENGYFVLSMFEVPPVWPCDPTERVEPSGTDMWPNCDCELAVSDPWTTTIVYSPVISPYWQYGVPTTEQSRLDLNEVVERYLAEQIRTTCFKLKNDRQAIPTRHRFVITEVGFDHQQLLGVPFISNYVTDPVPMYIPTTMRYNEGRDITQADLEFICGWDNGYTD